MLCINLLWMLRRAKQPPQTLFNNKRLFYYEIEQYINIKVINN